ncbi:MAG TPA: prolyl oligopeptidase family serine peptidase, partial [Limnochordia bacterium]|nr:prolyl oligopeptidase family serine peptidase [Limnochordia bacterium]
MHIREYLVRAAEAMTQRALVELPSPAEWARQLPAKRAQFHEMLGIDRWMAAERTPLNVQVTGTLQREGFRIELLHYESLPGLYVAANLYVPDGLKGRAPGLVYVCGHSLDQKVNYQDHARRFAQLGFVVLIVDTIELGEVRGNHHGTHRYGWFNWISRGYTPAGVEVWNAMRGFDLLAARDDVDAERLGITGTSGGGAITWWTAVADERVKVAAPSCGTATTASHVRERTVDGHCDCMFPANLYGWSLLEMSALVAPRPLLIASAGLDGIFTIAAIEEFYARLKGLYRHLGRPDDINLVTFAGPHSYHEATRTGIVSWFVRHLQGGAATPATVGDIDGVRESAADLAV